MTKPSEGWIEWRGIRGSQIPSHDKQVDILTTTGEIQGFWQPFQQAWIVGDGPFIIEDSKVLLWRERITCPLESESR